MAEVDAQIRQGRQGQAAQVQFQTDRCAVESMFLRRLAAPATDDPIPRCSAVITGGGVDLQLIGTHVTQAVAAPGKDPVVELGFQKIEFLFQREQAWCHGAFVMIPDELPALLDGFAREQVSITLRPGVFAIEYGGMGRLHQLGVRLFKASPVAVEFSPVHGGEVVAFKARDIVDPRDDSQRLGCRVEIGLGNLAQAIVAQVQVVQSGFVEQPGRPLTEARVFQVQCLQPGHGAKVGHCPQLIVGQIDLFQLVQCTECQSALLIQFYLV
ncbi:hypothetical protein D3C72_509370 [compost metagenome]